MNGYLTENQQQLMEKWKMNNYKCLISSDYDECIKEIILYMQKKKIWMFLLHRKKEI